MGGVSQSVVDGVISIASVRGNIVINASATQTESADLFALGDKKTGGVKKDASGVYSLSNFGVHRVLSVEVNVSEFKTVELSGLYDFLPQTSSAQTAYSWALFDGLVGQGGVFLDGTYSSDDKTIDLTQFANNNNLTLYVAGAYNHDGINPTDYSGQVIAKGYK